MSIIFTLIFVFLSALSFAQQGDYKEFDRRIQAELESSNPEAAKLFLHANQLRDKNDAAGAAALYRKVLELQPNFFHASRRLCSCELALDHRTEAIARCRDAMKVEPNSVENLSTLAFVLSSTAEGFAPIKSELQEASNLISKAMQMDRSNAFVAETAAQVGIASEDFNLLDQATTRLQALKPDDMTTHIFLSVRALWEGSFGTARKHLERAHQLGMPEEKYSSLLDAINTSEPIHIKAFRIGAPIGGIWIGGLVLLLGAGWILSVITLRAVKNAPVESSAKATGMDSILRKIYSGVIFLSGVYYYVSIPLLLVTVIALGAGFIYMFFVIGQLPIKLMIIAFIITALTVWGILKSIFVRVKDKDPGTRLHLNENPELQKVLQEVATKIQTRPVDNVYMTPGVEIAVMERGGFLKKMRGSAERCLILGAGVLDGFQLSDFKAILAHEYGHLVNRDTAGGGFALSVRRSLLTMAQNLAQSGAANWYNPAWLFLNAFYRVFLRISHGASRLQEILADRWAALAYGTRQFENGLRHVVERSVRFNVQANAAVNAISEGVKSIANLYKYEPEEKVAEEEITEAIQKELQASPSPYDSHPCPADRFDLVCKLQGAADIPPSDPGVEMWSLFADPEKLQHQLTDEVRNYVSQQYIPES